MHPAQADEILALMSNLAGEFGAALAITTHDQARAAAAGFAIAQCRPDATTAATRFGWAPRARAPGSGHEAVA